MTIIGTGAFNVVNGKLDLILIAGFDHFIGFNEVEGSRFFTEDMDTALCRGDCWRVVHRCLCWDDDDVGLFFVKHLFVVVIDGFDAESFAPGFCAFWIDFRSGDEFTVRF